MKSARKGAKSAKERQEESRLLCVPLRSSRLCAHVWITHATQSPQGVFTMLARYVLIAGLLAVSGLTASAAEPASLELMGTIVLKGKPGKLDHLALDAKRERLFVANKVNNTLDVVDLKAG